METQETFQFNNDSFGDIDSSFTNDMVEKPPLELMPRWLLNKKRISKIKEAINRYFDTNYAIPVEWIQEYNELIQSEQYRNGTFKV